MNSDQKIEIEIFNTAWDIDSAEERGRYLDEACAGDSDRRRRIEALLQAYANSDSIFASEPRSSHQTEFERPTEGPGTILGPYKLLQQIGEGGMGIVYMAEQQQPVQRKVALKIIKVGMDTRQVVARFEAERQALAMMDHPNIAKVFDGGSTNSGRPYFVMELVQGVPITDFCDKNKLSTRERIELLIPVCQAIQSAHQKGIIHRDIKPSNVLVTLHHGEPMAKVIDFGVAKATNHKLTEKTLFTNFGTMIGTPAYMSPEQAEMTSTDVDTRTDVYSLGVLLYELLTGTTPFDQKELLSKGYGEMQRVIAEEEPDKPSLRMSTLAAETRTAIAKSRRLDALNLTQLFRGDLDCITMKCLEKDRRRRYDTPNELIADLKRHLNNEPVSAAPPTSAYRFQKFYRRKRALVHSVVAIGITLMVATIISISMAVRMNHLRQQAIQAEKKALTQATVAKAVNNFLNDDLLKQAEAWNEPDPDIKLRTVVDRAAETVESKLKDQPLVEAAIHLTLSGIFRSLDDQKKAKYHADRAKEIYERDLGQEHLETLKATAAFIQCVREEGNIDTAKFEQACKLASDLLATARRVLGAEHETTLGAFREVVATLGVAHRYHEQEIALKEAITLHEKVLGKTNILTLSMLGNLSWNRITYASQFEEAVAIAREVIKRAEAFPADHPFHYEARAALELALGYAGTDREERRKLAQANVDFARSRYGPRHTKTIKALENRAMAAASREEYLKLITEAHQLALDHWGPKNLRTLHVQRYVAEALAQNDDRVKAEELFLSGLDNVRTNFGRGKRLVLDYIWQIGMFYAQQNPDKAETYFKELAELALETQGERCVHYQFALVGLSNLYYGKSERRSEQIAMNQKLLELRKRMWGIRHKRTTLILSILAECLAFEGRAAEADTSIAEAAEEFSKSHPKSEDDWLAFRHVVTALGYSTNKMKFSALLRDSVTNPLKNVHARSTVAEFYRVAGDVKAAHAAYQTLSREFPDIHWHWYAQSAAAIEAGDIADHLFCSREMLKRFGSEEKDIGMLDRVLKTFFLAPNRWTSEELAGIQVVYDRLNQAVEKQHPETQVFDRAALALADFRLEKLESALSQLNKLEMLQLPLKGINWGQARAVAGLCHGALGDYDKAAAALDASKTAVDKHPFADPADLTRWKFLLREAQELLQSSALSQLPARVGSR